jgi:hypothetical protein
MMAYGRYSCQDISLRATRDDQLELQREAGPGLDGIQKLPSARLRTVFPPALIQRIDYDYWEPSSRDIHAGPQCVGNEMTEQFVGGSIGRANNAIVQFSDDYILCWRISMSEIERDAAPQSCRRPVKGLVASEGKAGSKA